MRFLLLSKGGDNHPRYRATHRIVPVGAISGLPFDHFNLSSSNKPLEFAGVNVLKQSKGSQVDGTYGKILGDAPYMLALTISSITQVRPYRYIEFVKKLIAKSKYGKSNSTN